MRSILALSVALLLGCSQELPAPLRGEGTETPRRGGTLTFASSGDLRGLDPASIGDGLAPQILEAMFAGLVDYDVGGKIVPDIAERWTVDDDGKTYRFFLRPGVRFHDGTEVTAEDVKRSVERALDPKTPNPYASYYGMLDGVRVEGEHVVAFALKEPDATFLPLVAMLQLRPVCKSAGTRYDPDWLPCGAGPFKLGDWQRGLTLTLTRHEGYFRAGLPYLDALRWTFHEPVTSQYFKFVQGELDVARELSSTDTLRFQADPRWTPFGEPEVDKTITGESMNVELPPFDNVEIRRAVAAAFDRGAMRKGGASTFRPTGQCVPYDVFGHDPSLKEQTFDLGAALEHMRRAGYPFDPATDTGGWPGVVPYVVYKASALEYTGQLLAQQLARIGIRIELRLVNYPTWLALRGRRGASAFGPNAWLQDFPDALSFLEPLFHSRSISDESSNNNAFWVNPRFDALVDRAHHELDDAQRMKTYSEAQAILIEDAPWAFTENAHLSTQRQGYVRGQRNHPMWTHDVVGAWLDRARTKVAQGFFSPRAVTALLGGR